MYKQPRNKQNLVILKYENGKPVPNITENRDLRIGGRAGLDNEHTSIYIHEI